MAMRQRLDRVGLLFTLCLCARPVAAQSGPLVRWPEALGFVAITGITMATDGSIRTAIQGHQSGFRNSLATLGNTLGNPRYVLPALVLGTIGGEVAGASGVRHGSWRALKSTALGTAATLALKSLIGRRRPDVSPDDPYRFHPVSFHYNSLPSGHTATAFSLATSIAMESKSDLTDVVVYGLAATTAFARVHVDKHWASDTVVGAGIGILAARIVRRHDKSAGSATPLIAVSIAF